MGEEKLSAAIICETGCSEFAAKELSLRYNITANKLSKAYVQFEADKETLVKITYTIQSAKRVLAVLSTGIIGHEIDDLKKSISQNITRKQAEHLMNAQSFRINCERTGEHNFNSVDAEQTAGIELEKIVGVKASVNLKNPNIRLFLNITDETYILGIDLAGKDLSKRQYRLFNHPGSIKGTIAFSLLMFSGYEKEKVLADAFSLSGEIVIEAALLQSNTSINYYDKVISLKKLKLFSDIPVEDIIKETDSSIIKAKGTPNIKSFDASFRNISAQKKNAKIAGIEKHIAFSRTDSHSVDLKLKEHSVDIICSKIIEPSKHFSEKNAQRIYTNFFRNVHLSLNKHAIICLIIRRPELLLLTAEKEGFKMMNKLIVHQGRQKLYFIKLTYMG